MNWCNLSSIQQSDCECVCGGFVSVCHTLLQTIMINALLKLTVQSINFVVSIQFLNVQTNRSCSFSELIGATNNNIVLLLQFDIAFFNWLKWQNRNFPWKSEMNHDWSILKRSRSCPNRVTQTETVKNLNWAGKIPFNFTVNKSNVARKIRFIPKQRKKMA